MSAMLIQWDEDIAEGACMRCVPEFRRSGVPASGTHRGGGPRGVEAEI